MYQILIRLLSFLLVITQATFKSKGHLLLENLALRQQLSTYHTKDKKPRLTNIDRLFWVAFSNVRLGFCKKLNDESWIELMRIF